MIRRERLRTPREHGAVLIEPGAAALRDALAIPPPDAPIGDVSLGELRASLRRRLGLTRRVIVTGHQAEFYHAGVLAKTIAADALARRHAADAAFLTVDSDTPKSTVLSFVAPDAAELRRERLPIPGLDASLPMESQPPMDARAWRDWFERLRRSAPAEALLNDFARGFLSAADAADSDFTTALIAGHAACAGALGGSDMPQLRMSSLAATPEFAAFAAHWFEHAHSFSEQYNRALDRYRKRHRVRGADQPAARLAIGPDFAEAPFWAFRSGQPRRHLFVHRGRDGVSLRANRDAIGDGPTAARAISAASADGWQIRPRALLLSGFVRLCLADLFIHGIGGAKYDEVTDDFAQACFGCVPALNLCVSATLHAFPAQVAAASEAPQALRRLRDFPFNPQRYVAKAPHALLARRDAILAAIHARKRRAHRQRGDYRRESLAEARQLHAALMETLQELRALDPRLPERLRSDVDRAAARASHAALAADRESFYALLPAHELSSLAERIRASLA